MSMTDARRRLAARTTLCTAKPFATNTTPMRSGKPKKTTQRERSVIIPASPTISPAQVIRAPRITRMDTLWQCRKVLRAILKAMARGDIPASLGTRMAYCANMISTIVKCETELSELSQLREKIEQLQRGGRVPLLAHDDGEYIPAAVQPSEDQSS